VSIHPKRPSARVPQGGWIQVSTCSLAAARCTRLLQPELCCCHLAVIKLGNRAYSSDTLCAFGACLGRTWADAGLFVANAAGQGDPLWR
jgi:hypothetical protein